MTAYQQFLQDLIDQKLEGWCDVQKARMLHDTVLADRPALIVEIGVFGGRSVIAMGFAAQDIGARVVAIDPWSTGPCLEGKNTEENDKWWAALDLEAIYNGYVKAVEAYGLTGTIETMRCTDEFALPKFKDGSIGMIHIDGNHSEETSMRYVQEWGSKISKGGLLVMDDTGWQSQAKAVAHLNAHYTSIYDHKDWAIWKKS